MTTIDLKLSSLEKKQLLIWADHTISGGHWGNGDVVFPEENITLSKIQKSEDGLIQANRQDLRVMLIWCENAVGSTLKGLTPEERSVIDKVKNANTEMEKLI